jgi:folate-dependent phosphoribosylglycinamide formyltransferase PurN
MRDYRVGFCVSGQGRLCQAAVSNAATLGITPALVIAEAKAHTELDGVAAARGIRMTRLPPIRGAAFDQSLVDACLSVELDLLVLTFDRLLPPELVRGFPGRIVNLHPGLLPAFKGMRPMQQALSSGARFTGATMHEVDEGIDTGPIVAQTVIALHENETVEALGSRLFAAMRPLYLQVIAWYAAGRVVRNEDGSLNVRHARYGDLPTSPSIELTL